MLYFPLDKDVELKLKKNLSSQKAYDSKFSRSSV